MSIKDFTVGAVIVLMSTLGVAVVGYEFNKYFSPKYEEIRRHTYEQSAAYNQGMVRDLENLQMGYESASPEQKLALKPIIIHRFSVYNVNMLPANLQLFYNSLKGTP